MEALDGGDVVADAGVDVTGDSDYWNQTSAMEVPKPSDNLLSLKITMDNLQIHCRKTDLETGEKMSQQGDIFFSEIWPYIRL